MVNEIAIRRKANKLLWDYYNQKPKNRNVCEERKPTETTETHSCAEMTNVVDSCEKVCPFKDCTLIQLLELADQNNVNVHSCFERKELIQKLRLANVSVASADDPRPLSSGVGDIEEQEDLIADKIEPIHWKKLF